MTEEDNKAAAIPDTVGSDQVAPVLIGPRWSWKVWLIWCVSTYVIFVAEAYLGVMPGKKDPTFLLVMLVGAPIPATFYYGIYFLIKRAVYRGLLRRGQALAITEKAEVLQEDLEKNFFTNLVKINFKYLDKYYLQTQEQGDRSFLLCLIAALIGLSIITAGIVMMFFDKVKPAYITTGAGVLAEFIAAVFFYLYNQTVIRMSEYHQKLVLTQNIAIALKITDDLPAPQRVDAQIGLIQALTKDVNNLLAQHFEGEQKA
jgi:hypothetical protein